MDESLTQQGLVSEEGPWVVKLCPRGKIDYKLIANSFDGTLEESTG